MIDKLRMPLYEYACEKCKNHFEVNQKFSDAPLEKCQLDDGKCDGKVTKVLSLGGFSLKGTGWYATDYKKSGGGSSKDNS